MKIGNSELTLIQQAVRRISKIIQCDDIFILTNDLYFELVKEQLHDIKTKNIIVELFARNTAPCVALASKIIQDLYNDATVVVLASYHMILSEKNF